MCAWLVGLLETLEAIFGRQRFCTCVVCWGCSNLAELTGFPVQVLGMGNSQNTFPQFGFFYGSENEPPSRFDDKLESRLILAKPLTGLARTLRGVTPPTAVGGTGGREQQCFVAQNFALVQEEAPQEEADLREEDARIGPRPGDPDGDEALQEVQRGLRPATEGDQVKQALKSWDDFRRHEETGKFSLRPQLRREICPQEPQPSCEGCVSSSSETCRSKARHFGVGQAVLRVPSV